MRRFRILTVLFFVWVMAVIARAFMFQVWERDRWVVLGQSQYERRLKLVAKRGMIYDRGMRILAMDLPILSLAVDCTRVSDFEATAEILSETLGGSPIEYMELLRKNASRSFLPIHRDIDDEDRKTLMESGQPGWIFIRERKREHPHEALAYQALGITNTEHRGVGGVEQAMEDALRGGDGWAVYQRDALNRNFTSLDYPTAEPENGRHVILTLDHAFQTVVEEELRKGIEGHRARWGCAVLMDPFTGEVLAMASQTGPDTDAGENSFAEKLRNRPVQVDFEPGSTLKIVTAAAALEEGLFEPTTLIHCENGEFRWGNHTIHDHDEAYDWLTLAQVLEHSSNIGISKVGKALGKERLYRYVRDFGFGNRTGISLPGESPGILRPVFEWSEYSVASISFGQEVSATAIQLGCMVSAVANGGLLMRPRIVDSVIDDHGNPKHGSSRQVIRRVISEETASTLRNILRGVVENGSGKMAAVEGVAVAGKTGTAQKSAPDYRGYIPGAHVSSFVGYWPAETPMFSLVVVLDEPQLRYQGSQSAAPVFSRIVGRIVGIPGRYRPKQKTAQRKYVLSTVTETPREEDTPGVQAQDSPYHIPNLVGLSVRDALQQLAARGVEARVSGHGVIARHEPSAGQKVADGSVCYLTCREE